MITVELRFTEYSLLTYICFVFFAAPAALAIYLAAKCYVFLNLQIAASLIAAFILLDLVAIILSGTASRRVLAIAPHCVTLPALFTVVVYWLSARLSCTFGEKFWAGNEVSVHRYEAAMISLTALMLMISCSILTLPFLMSDSEFPRSHQPQQSQDTGYTSKSDDLFASDVLRPRARNSLATLRNEMPVAMAEQTSQPNGQFLWNNPPPSLHIDRDGTKIPSPHKALSNLINSKRNSSMPSFATPVPASLVGLEAIPEGTSGLDWEGLGAQTDDNIRWIIEQSGHRSVSGSTDRSVSAFSVADYNRRINDAGFVREDNKFSGSKGKLTLSHYDQERLRQANL